MFTTSNIAYKQTVQTNKNSPKILQHLQKTISEYLYQIVIVSNTLPCYKESVVYKISDTVENIPKINTH